MIKIPHEEKVVIASRLRDLLHQERLGCVVRGYSNGKPVATKGIHGTMFCWQCPDADYIPWRCSEACLDDRLIDCEYLGACPCSVPWNKRRLRFFMRWLLRRQYEECMDRLVRDRRQFLSDYLDLKEE